MHVCSEITSFPTGLSTDRLYGSTCSISLTLYLYVWPRESVRVIWSPGAREGKLKKMWSLPVPGKPRRWPAMYVLEPGSQGAPLTTCAPTSKPPSPPTTMAPDMPSCGILRYIVGSFGGIGAGSSSALDACYSSNACSSSEACSLSDACFSSDDFSGAVGGASATGGSATCSTPPLFDVRSAPKKMNAPRVRIARPMKTKRPVRRRLYFGCFRTRRPRYRFFSISAMRGDCSRPMPEMVPQTVIFFKFCQLLRGIPRRLLARHPNAIG